MTSKIRRTIALVSTIVMMLALSAPAVSAQDAAVPWDEADFSAYATGTNVHLDAIELIDVDDTGEVTTQRVTDVDVGFTGATADTADLGYNIDNEMGRLVQPPTLEDDLSGQFSYGRASVAELGLGTETPWGEGDVILPDLVWASAPPSEANEDVLIPVEGDPLAWVHAASAQAEANWSEEHCILGEPLSAGESFAEDLQLLDAGAMDDNGDNDNGDVGAAQENGLEQPLIAMTADDPDRATINSRSHTFLGPVHDAPELGAAPYAEVRQTLAPITLFEGQDIEITIELLGEWVLWATAGGEPGTAHVHYGPAETDPETPIVRVWFQGEEAGELLFQDLLGEDGLNLPIGDPELGFLANVTVGEAPRAIDGEHGSEPEIAADGTYAAAAVDVVRVQLLQAPELFEGADLRVGHMEVEVENEGGPIICEAPMDKIVDPETVEAGEDFEFIITVENPFACELVGDLVDVISVESGNPSWTVVGTDPEADEVSDDLIVWRDIAIPAGETRQFTIQLEADDDSEAGTLRNDAFLDDAHCEGGPVDGESTVTTDVPVVGDASVVGPGIGPAVAEPAVLPVTGGGNAAALIGLLLAAGALLLRSRGNRNSGIPEEG